MYPLTVVSHNKSKVWWKWKKSFYFDQTNIGNKMLERNVNSGEYWQLDRNRIAEISFAQFINMNKQNIISGLMNAAAIITM